MILKKVEVLQTRYFASVKNLTVRNDIICNEEEMTTLIENTLEMIEDTVEIIVDFVPDELDYNNNHFIKTISFDSEDGMKIVITMSNMYYMNDNGKTVETI